MQHSSVSIHQPPQVGRLNNGNGSHSESKTSAISTGGERSINTIIFPLPTESFMLPHSPPPRKATWKFNFQSRGRTPNLEILLQIHWGQREWPKKREEVTKQCSRGGILMPTDYFLLNLTHHPVLFPPLYFPCSLHTQTCINTI